MKLLNNHHHGWEGTIYYVVSLKLSIKNVCTSSDVGWVYHVTSYIGLEDYSGVL